MANVTITLTDSKPADGQEGIAVDLTVKIDMTGTLFREAINSPSLVLGMGMRNLLADTAASQRLVSLMRKDPEAFHAQLSAMLQGKVR